MLLMLNPYLPKSYHSEPSTPQRGLSFAIEGLVECCSVDSFLGTFTFIEAQSSSTLASILDRTYLEYHVVNFRLRTLHTLDSRKLWAQRLRA